MVRAILYGALMWAVCIYAFLRGGRDERLVAGGILANTYLSVLAMGPMASRYQHVETAVVVVDAALLLLLLYIALRSQRFWPLWLTAMHGLAMMGHLAPFVPHALPWSYYNAAVIWSYPMLIVLGFAVHRNSGSGRSEHRFRS